MKLYIYPLKGAVKQLKNIGMKEMMYNCGVGNVECGNKKTQNFLRRRVEFIKK